MLSDAMGLLQGLPLRYRKETQKTCTEVESVLMNEKSKVWY